MPKLNLGCGQEHEKGYINIDIQEPCDLKHDLRTSLPFADNSVDEIYAKDFIRVLSRSERQRLNKEISRVLKPGGKLQIIYLDFESAARAFLDSKLIKDRGRWLKFIFGGQRNEYHFCKDGLTRRKLITCLFRNGLSGFKIKQFLKDDPDYEGYFSLTCYKKLPTLFSHKSKLKILAGTPIHINYPAEKWLERISRLKYPVDLLMVDSSPTLDYVEKVKGYCAKYGIKNYKIKHLEIGQFQPWAEKVGRSREII
ncbi:MAG: methyltransferase domain-containing protein, partial [Candidatus Nealsonbacteria bacterium]|nr:methyltransferase domain-containing protein [Candidatus Nealsonbacteria bacterium]